MRRLKNDWLRLETRSSAVANRPRDARTLCAGWNEYLAKAGRVNRHIRRMIHQPVSVVSQCSLNAWLNGLASGDQRWLTGSGSALEACSRWCAIQIHILLYFTCLLYVNLKNISNLFLRRVLCILHELSIMYLIWGNWISSRDRVLISHVSNKHIVYSEWYMYYNIEYDFLCY